MKYEAKVQYEKIDELSGKEKKVTETYILDAETFGDAEEKTFKEMAKITTATVIATIKKSDYVEIGGDLDAGKYYRVIVKQEDIDELSGKVKSINTPLLIGASRFFDAWQYTEEWCKGLITDTEITKIGKSNLSFNKNWRKTHHSRL